jgi:hypothetical protein
MRRGPNSIREETACCTPVHRRCGSRRFPGCERRATASRFSRRHRSRAAREVTGARPDQLEGDGAAERLLDRLVHDAHASAAGGGRDGTRRGARGRPSAWASLGKRFMSRSAPSRSRISAAISGCARQTLSSAPASPWAMRSIASTSARSILSRARARPGSGRA